MSRFQRHSPFSAGTLVQMRRGAAAAMSRLPLRRTGLHCALLGMALLSANCSPGASSPKEAAPDSAMKRNNEEPVQAYLPPPPAAFSGDFVLRGARDGWRVEISDAELTVYREGRPAMKAVHSGPRMAGDQAVWAAEAAGEPLVVVLIEASCQLQRGGASYAYAAEVQIEDETLGGCAERSPSRSGAVQ